MPTPESSQSKRSRDEADSAGSLGSLRRRLEATGNGHVLRFLDQISDTDRAALIRQVEGLDIESLPRLARDYVLNQPESSLPPEMKPAPYYPRDPKRASRSWDEAEFRSIGQTLLRDGKVAAFVVAGGQGSRLGYEGPKGCYSAGAVTGKPLFQVFAEAILGAKDRYGVAVPWYIMTSPHNHAQTIEYFEAKGFFGLSRKDLMFFPQGVMPSFDIKSGKVLMASKSRIATNPDGHGGSLNALHVSGALADMRRRGVDMISYFQVDNPIVNVLDPVFLGLHATAPDSSGQMSSKMVRKTGPDEKVGVFCVVGAGARMGRVEIVEYSDLPREIRNRTDPDGSLTFIAGSIAVHIIGVDFVGRLNTDPGFGLPYHRAEKSVPCINPSTGEPAVPAGNNAVKLERFVFDALPLCEASIVYETDRVEEFAPIKNADAAGTVVADSPASSHAIQTLRAARWMEACGVQIPRRRDGTPDCILEISPRTATTAEELRTAMLSGVVGRINVERGARVAL